MKDFHDLFSLIFLGNLDAPQTEKAIQLVFNHRNTSLKGLPITLEKSALNQLEKTWNNYLRKINHARSSTRLPTSIERIIDSLNQWIAMKTLLCSESSVSQTKRKS